MYYLLFCLSQHKCRTIYSSVTLTLTHLVNFLCLSLITIYVPPSLSLSILRSPFLPLLVLRVSIFPPRTFPLHLFLYNMLCFIRPLLPVFPLLSLHFLTFSPYNPYPSFASPSSPFIFSPSKCLLLFLALLFLLIFTRPLHLFLHYSL